MSQIDRISVIQNKLREIVDELESLKHELGGERVPDFDEANMGVFNQLNDLAKNLNKGDVTS